MLYTGDLFRTDADGYLYFVARKDDIIKTRGEKVAPREVENTIHRLADVASCAVVGVPDDGLGQAIKAFVVLRPGVGAGAAGHHSALPCPPGKLHGTEVRRDRR